MITTDHRNLVFAGAESWTVIQFRGAVGSLALSAAFMALFACAPKADSPEIRSAAYSDPDPVTATLVDARPPALIQGRVVEWTELRPLLNEAAGAEILREVVLDRMLGPALHEAGIVITADDIDAERGLFYSTLSGDPDVAVRLARELRARQGIGTNRFERLLRRNASLRALVRDEVEVTEEQTRQWYETLYGPKRRVRLLTTATLPEAQTAVRRVRTGEFFGDVAVEISTDSSAARGGLLEPFSQDDPSYPEALREAVWSMSVGEVSPPILIGGSFAVVMLVGEVEREEVEYAEVRPQLEREVRLTQERLLMDQAARQLFSEATITIFDDPLKESWDWRRRR